MEKTASSTETTLPLFIPEWSIWDRVITYHYEDASRPAKDFMYELVQLNVDRQVKLSVIPYELKRVLDAAFSGRGAFDFLLEHGASIESLPPLLTRMFNGAELHHSIAVILLGFWESLNFPEVYIVTEDATFKDGMEKLNKTGLNFAHLKIINPTEALRILTSKCK